MKEKHWIDAHKGLTWLAVVAMMAIHDSWSNPTVWLYLGLHGTYGLLWVLKSRVFPDKKWDKPASLGRGLAIAFGLSLYWIAPWIVTSQGVTVPTWMFAAAPSVYAVGVFLHFSADMQKFTALKLRPEELIEDGLFANARNVNYFGELLIYMSFAALSLHVLPFLVLLAFVLFIWIPNMRRKDRSLSRYPEFEDYRSRSSFFVPFIF
ncbi:MAG: DUF1295 domain-containing protein [Anaerolineales bacterium]|nr:DUF1295 domain-containing protein [Anaerolineales bacterium]